MAATHTGTGWWITKPTGAVTPYGTAASYGSMATHPLNAPVVGIASTPSGRGYYVVAADGGVFSFSAPFYGSEGSHPPPVAAVGLAVTPGGTGCSVVDGAGTATTFGP